MELKAEKIEVRDFNITLNKREILSAASCGEGSAVYETAARCFDELHDELTMLADFYAVAYAADGRVYCCVTVGGRISDYISRLFDAGEAVKGLIADIMADSMLFEADKLLTQRIKRECAVSGCGIKGRMTAPEDFPLSEQGFIIEKTKTKRITLTEAFMLNPVKSIAYILELTDDKEIFNAQHDCSKCSCADCPLRKREYSGEFEIVSEYDYVPSLCRGRSAVCIDIGTTTVVFELITDTGAVRSYKTVNPQRRFGLDVLSRIEAANRGREDELSMLIRYTLFKGFKEVTDGFGPPDSVIIAGNTTMIYLLMKYPCDKLGKYPFKTEHLSIIHTTLDKITVKEAPAVPVCICGGVSAFVGGDIVSGLYMCGFDRSERLSLFLDLGTNGEMAVGNRDRIITASAAAGPAFEGGRISCGMSSVDGAVYSVRLNPNEVKTIGNKPPAGICGTGIIELVSELYEHKIIDHTGLFSGGYFEDGFKAAQNVVFTQADIREVQTAKAAVRAGIECVMAAYGAKYDDIDAVYIAGGFGYRLPVKSACGIGILPPALAGKTKAVGNSSLGGCVKFCSETDAEESMKRIQSISSELPLGGNKNFEKLYIHYMNF